MSPSLTHSVRARSAYALVVELQTQFQRRLTALCTKTAGGGHFIAHEWLRDEGRHGGGSRQTYADGTVFNRASLNVSHVHYDDMPERPLGSASALSSIVHPAHPKAPSLHIHISWTEMKAGAGSWRLMADLNPSLAEAPDEQYFRNALSEVARDTFADAIEQGDRYFHIPVLQRHRGVAHFYLEQHRTDDEVRDRAFADAFGHKMIDTYADILQTALRSGVPPSEDEYRKQRAYHTVYLFQVLTLDRGTTSGLLVHDQNDLGILGSLPAVVDRVLLASWIPLMASPQDELLHAIVAVVPQSGNIGDPEKLAFCAALRLHYAKHPTALEMQARGNVIPPTVTNHGR